MSLPFEILEPLSRQDLTNLQEEFPRFIGECSVFKLTGVGMEIGINKFRVSGRDENGVVKINDDLLIRYPAVKSQIILGASQLGYTGEVGVNANVYLPGGKIGYHRDFNSGQSPVTIINIHGNAVLKVVSSTTRFRVVSHLLNPGDRIILNINGTRPLHNVINLSNTDMRAALAVWRYK